MTSSPSVPFWWRDERLADRIQIALNQVNEARQRRAVGGGWELDACRDCFGALNRLWTTLYSDSSHDESSPPRGQRYTESRKLLGLLKTLPPAERTALLGRPNVAAFAAFEPSILDHSVAGGDELLADITPGVRIEAAESHDAFKRGWQLWRETGASEVDVIDRLSRAVLVVRNNLAHGEKTRRGPDRERVERNRAVAKVVLPVLEDIVDFVLDRPTRKFIAYGTLRPGQPNNGVITVDGTWTAVSLGGVIHEESGLPAFTFEDSAASVDADLFESPSLPDQWELLDQFEGDRYERNLGLYRHEGRIGVANIYVWSDAADDR